MSSLTYTLSKKLGFDLSYFFKNGFWVILRQLVGVLAALVTTTVFTRLSSQEVFGNYQFVLSVIAVIAIFSLPGLNTSLLQAVSKGKDGNYKSVVRLSFLWSLLGVPVMLGLGVYYYLYRDQSLGIALMLASIFFPFFYAPNSWDIFLQGKGRFDVSSKYGTIQALVNAAITTLVVFFFSHNVVAIVASYLLSYTFFNICFFWVSWRYISNQEMDENVVPYGFFITKINIIGFIADNLDRLLIGLMLSSSQLAVYSIGILFSKQIQNISKSLLAMYSPKQIRAGEIPRALYGKLFLLGAVITVFCLFAFRYLIPLFFSDKYTASIRLSEIAILFFPFYLLSVVYSNQYVFTNQEKILSQNSFIAPILKIILTVVLLYYFGITGLAFLFGFQYVLMIAVLYTLNYLRVRTR